MTILSKNMKVRMTSAAMALALILGGFGSSRAVAAGGSVKGVANFDGPRPVPKVIDRMRDRTFTGGATSKSQCEVIHADEPLLSEAEVVSENGEIANVFVYVDGDFEKDEYPNPEEAAELNQLGCQYFPHVQGVRTGQTIKIINSDDMLHNVRAYGRRNRPFNLGQPTKGNVREKNFRRAEDAIKIACDVHQWMQSYIFAMEHPFFAVTGPDGSYEITGVPAGDYTLAVWHETYGKQKHKITVGEDGVVTQDLTFVPKEEK